MFTEEESKRERQRAQDELTVLRLEIGVLMMATVVTATFWWIALNDSESMWWLFTAGVTAATVWLFLSITRTIAGRIRVK